MVDKSRGVLAPVAGAAAARHRGVPARRPSRAARGAVEAGGAGGVGVTDVGVTVVPFAGGRGPIPVAESFLPRLESLPSVSAPSSVPFPVRLRQVCFRHV